MNVIPLRFDDSDRGRPEIWSARLNELFDYWHAKRGRRAAATRGQIDPSDIPALLPIVFLVDVEHDPLRFRFRLVGTEFCEKFGRDFTGARLEDVNRQHAARDTVIGDYERCAGDVVPVVSRNAFPNDMGVEWRYEHLLLPLLGDDGRVNMLLGGMEIRIPIREWRKLEELHGARPS